MRSRRGAAAILLVLALAVSLVLATKAKPQVPEIEASPPTTTSTIAATTTTRLETTTTAMSTTTTTLAVVDDAPPTVDLRADTFEELRAVWDQIDAYWAWLNAHPTDDPAVLGVIFDPDGVEYARQMETMAGLANDGLRLIAPTAIGEVTAFGCCPDPQTEMDSGSITLALRTTWSDDHRAVLVDTADQVVEEFPGWRLQSWLVTLRLSKSGGWLVEELAGQ